MAKKQEMKCCEMHRGCGFMLFMLVMLLVLAWLFYSVWMHNWTWIIISAAILLIAKIVVVRIHKNKCKVK